MNCPAWCDSSLWEALWRAAFWWVPWTPQMAYQCVQQDHSKMASLQISSAPTWGFPVFQFPVCQSPPMDCGPALAQGNPAKMCAIQWGCKHTFSNEVWTTMAPALWTSKEPFQMRSKVVLMNVIFQNCMMECVDICKVCLTQWTNISKWSVRDVEVPFLL